jgi:hypothetical protein
MRVSHGPSLCWPNDGCFRRLLALPTVAAATAACLVACTSETPPQVPSPTSLSVASTSPTTAARPSAPTEDQQVLRQYAAFWTVITSASQAAASRRPALLAPYATEPELSRLLRGLLATDAAGQRQYGAAIPRARVVSIRGATASVADCQNAAGAGLASRTTGERLTRGVVRNPVNATLLRGSDGRWRVSTVEFTKGRC